MHLFSLTASLAFAATTFYWLCLDHSYHVIELIIYFGYFLSLVVLMLIEYIEIIVWDYWLVIVYTILHILLEFVSMAETIGWPVYFQMLIKVVF